MLGGANQIVGMMQGLLSSKKGKAADGLNEAAIPQSTQTARTDQFTLSVSLQQALELLNSENSGDKAPEMDLSGIENLKSRGEMLSQVLQMKLQSFQSDFINQAKTAGIDTTQPVELKKGETGELLVSNNHPDKAKIEQLLAQDEDLAKKFQDISKMAGLSQALQSLSGEKSGSPMSMFAALYAKQSQGEQAAKTVNPDRMSLKIDEASASFSFQ